MPDARPCPHTRAAQVLACVYGVSKRAPMVVFTPQHSFPGRGPRRPGLFVYPRGRPNMAPAEGAGAAPPPWPGFPGEGRGRRLRQWPRGAALTRGAASISRRSAGVAQHSEPSVARGGRIRPTDPPIVCRAAPRNRPVRLAPRPTAGS